jgi:GTP-binding protein
VVPISCLSEEGLPRLRKELLKRVRRMRAKEKKSPNPAG